MTKVLRLRGSLRRFARVLTILLVRNRKLAAIDVDTKGQQLQTNLTNEELLTR